MMSEMYAKEFSGIFDALNSNANLQGRTLKLIEEENIAGKVTEGDGRTEAVRTILTDLINGAIGLGQAYQRVDTDLPQSASSYKLNKRVFPHGWQERLIRTQLSRFYNQAVMEILLERGDTLCYVPHSSAEDINSNCSVMLAGRNHEIDTLYRRLVQSYSDGDWTNEPKIPDHPHCSHVVQPISEK